MNLISLHQSTSIEIRRESHNSSECDYELIELIVTNDNGDVTNINIFSDEKLIIKGANYNDYI